MPPSALGRADLRTCALPKAPWGHAGSPRVGVVSTSVRARRRDRAGAWARAVRASQRRLRRISWHEAGSLRQQDSSPTPHTHCFKTSSPQPAAIFLATPIAISRRGETVPRGPAIRHGRATSPLLNRGLSPFARNRGMSPLIPSSAAQAHEHGRDQRGRGREKPGDDDELWWQAG